jgi:hypothetical protein
VVADDDDDDLAEKKSPVDEAAGATTRAIAPDRAAEADAVTLLPESKSKCCKACEKKRNRNK